MLRSSTPVFNYDVQFGFSGIYCIISTTIIYILGIAVTGASDISTDFVSSNQITDYSYVPHNVLLDGFSAILRCATGVGPAGSDRTVTLGGWYFNGERLFVPSGGSGCMDGHVFEVRGANARLYPGVINLYRCDTFTTTEEGVYSCIIMNSSMVEQTMRVGVYFSGRSESLDMYPITSLLTIFHLSTQLLQ